MRHILNDIAPLPSPPMPEKNYLPLIIVLVLLAVVAFVGIWVLRKKKLAAKAAEEAAAEEQAGNAEAAQPESDKDE